MIVAKMVFVILFVGKGQKQIWFGGDPQIPRGYMYCAYLISTTQCITKVNTATSINLSTAYK